MSLFSIPPHAPFLPTLAAAVMDGRLLGDWPRTGPFWLSDVTIVLPTQRAKRVLAQAFLEHPDFSGLLPDIRTFGGEVEDEEPFLPPFEAAALPRPSSRHGLAHPREARRSRHPRRPRKFSPWPIRSGWFSTILPLRNATPARSR
jgi:inactivated superfamily I helicase